MDSDLLLLQRYVADHDAEAFTALVRRYTGLVFNTAKRVTGNAVDAEDVVQECFLDLARQAAQIQDLLPAWLHCVATRRALNLRTSLTARRQREQAAVRDEPVRAPATVSGEWSEIGPLVDQAILSLPEELRSCLLLSFFDGLSHDDIAARLGCSRATVGRRIETAIKELRQQLDAPRRNLSALPAILLALPREVPPEHLLHEAIRIGLAGYGPAVPATTVMAASTSTGWWLWGGALGVTLGFASGIAWVVMLNSPQTQIIQKPQDPQTSESISAHAVDAQALPEAHGLLGTYFVGMQVSGQAVQRVDSVIDFNWGGQSPISQIPGEGFSVRWSGQLTVPKSDEYTFTVTADDGVWLAIDGKPVLDAWYGHYVDQRRITMHLSSDHPHAITLDYFQSLLNASIRLEWESPNLPRQLVPSAALRPTHPLMASASAGTSTGTLVGATETATKVLHHLELPEGCQQMALGSVHGAAHADPRGEEFSLVATGGTLTTTQDAGAVVSREVNGPATLTARLTWLYPQRPGTCAGIMWRSSAAPDAPAVVCALSPELGISALTRIHRGSVMQRSAIVPVVGSPWLRLQQSESRITSSYSLDGEHWSEVAAADLTVSGPTTMSLVLVGGTPTAYSGAVFNDVRLTLDAVPGSSESTTPPRPLHESF